jgi:hypothetical protein
MKPVVAKLKKVANKLRKRKIEDAVSYALGHGVRVDILCYLNESPAAQANSHD